MTTGEPTGVTDPIRDQRRAVAAPGPGGSAGCPGNRAGAYRGGDSVRYDRIRHLRALPAADAVHAHDHRSRDHELEGEISRLRHPTRTDTRFDGTPCIGGADR